MSDLAVQNAAQLSDALPGAATVQDYITLLKPRVMTLVVFTGAAGLVAAPGMIHPFLALIAILCIALASGAAGAINMWYDRDIDAVMARTRARPIPAGTISAGDALAFGIILTAIAVTLMGLAVNWLAAGLLALASAFYVFVYTIWLKRRTPQNIVIGGAAGAFPPMIGWAAVTSDVSLASISLFLLIFFWTPPHFWALSLYASRDYERAGVPMLSVVAGAAETKRHILGYAVILVPFALAPSFLGVTGPAYLAVAGVLSALFVGQAVRVLREREGYRAAKQMFGFSILYLFLLFAMIMIDAQGTVS